MAKYRYVSTRRRINYKGISMILVAVSAIVFTGSLTSGYFIKKNIKKAEASIESIEKDKMNLEEELNTLQEKTEELEKEAEALEEILWRYEPVIIPDSMK